MKPSIWISLAFVVIFIAAVVSCTGSRSRLGLEPAPPEAKQFIPQQEKALPYKTTGIASWYGRKWQGKETAAGDIFDHRELTAAHRTLPFGSKVKVRNLENGKEVVVEITDRGPNKRGRLIDLSRAAAQEIGLKEDGTGKVQIEVVDWPDEEPDKQAK